MSLGDEMYQLCARLFPICRSITGDGVRRTLKILQEHVPLEVHEVPTGTQAFDWTVPQEWNSRDAFIRGPDGREVVSFQNNNLHVVGYSVPIEKFVTLEELQEHLYSLPELPDAIPYVTSYYEKRWGFCLTEKQRRMLQPGSYYVYIDSSLVNGNLTYGELILPGQSEGEVFLSTYICHPSLANNELSGPVVTTYLAKWLMTLDRKYTYRIIFIPETIGSIVYLSRNLPIMKKNIIAGFNITCVGDDKAYSFLASRHAGTIADRVAIHVLRHLCPGYTYYSYLNRGSDERQYCSPGVDLPVVSIMRSKDGTYPEYHTSLDSLNFISPNGLCGSYYVLQKVLDCIEHNQTPATTVLCEPQLGRRGLYPTLSHREKNDNVRIMRDLLAYSDGKSDLLSIAELLGKPVWDLYPMAQRLKENMLLADVG